VFGVRLQDLGWLESEALAKRLLELKRIRDLGDHVFGFFPSDAAVGDGLTVAEDVATLRRLVAFYEIAFEHKAGELVFSFCETVRDVFGDGGLAAMILSGVAVRAIDHNRTAESIGLGFDGGAAGAGLVVVGTVVTSS